MENTILNKIKNMLNVKEQKDEHEEEFNLLKAQETGRFELEWSERKLYVNDKTATTSFDRHYTYHPAWAASVVKRISPKKHVDISSIIRFSTILSAFLPVEFYDYRPAEIKLPNFSCGKADLNDLPFKTEELESISCMHTVEHIGLGRYGDKIDYNGDLKAIDELKRVVKKKGSVLFVVPIGGKSKIVFNAHRIYTYAQILEYFAGFEMLEFALVTDSVKDGDFVINASKELANKQEYGCGCFWFKKL